MLLYFAGQADGLWTEGTAMAARLRLRMFTGGDGTLFVPSEGEVEGAYMLGRREFRFVLARLEAGRYPGLAVQTLVQAATIPSVEGVVSLAGDKVRLFYGVTPVEAAYVWYLGSAHLDTSAGFTNENRNVEAATAVRLRATFLVPPSVLLSVQGDYMRMWGPGDQLQVGGGERRLRPARQDRPARPAAALGELHPAQQRPSPPPARHGDLRPAHRHGQRHPRLLATFAPQGAVHEARQLDPRPRRRARHRLHLEDRALRRWPPHRPAAGRSRRPAPARPQEDPKAVYRVPLEDSPTRGPADALVTIVESSDFECPFCKRVGPTLKQLDEAFPGQAALGLQAQPAPLPPAGAARGAGGRGGPRAEG